MVGEASRIAFYDLDTSDLYFLKTNGQKLIFLVRSLWLIVNALLVKLRVPISFVSARRTALLYEMATADLVFFCGGGCLTGKTLSRLWDSMFIIRLACIFRTPCVLSGQTVGVWNSRFSRWLAGQGLKMASLIAIRDADGSVEALKELDLSPPQILTTCDDALFLEKRHDPDRIRGIFSASNLDPAIADSRFIVLNIHYWGFPEESDRQWLLDRAATILSRLADIDPIHVIGLPMIATDEQALLDLEQKRVHNGYRMLHYDMDFRIARDLISRSRICITMKHHPIIFALGERVPAISLSHGDYYEHKNGGALGLFKLMDCSVRLEQGDYADQFERIYRTIAVNRSDVVRQIERELPLLYARRKAFFDQVSNLLAKRRDSGAR